MGSLVHLIPQGVSFLFLEAPIQTASVFSLFSVNPEYSLNFSIKVIAFESDVSSLRINVVSSASWEILTMCCPIVIPTISLLFLIYIASVSTTNTNNNADKGHPCLIPRASLKKVEE